MMIYVAGFIGGIVGAFFALGCLIVFGIWMGRTPPTDKSESFYGCGDDEEDDDE